MRNGILKIYEGTKIIFKEEMTLISEPNTRQDRDGNLHWNVVRMRKHEKSFAYPFTKKWIFEDDEVKITFENPIEERPHPMILFFVPDNVTKIYKVED